MTGESARPDVSAWLDLELLRPLAGGARNTPYLARRRSEHFVVRTSSRLEVSLEWELDLLDTLDDNGLVVPRPVTTDDGRRHDEGTVVQRFIRGGLPHDRRDWERVVAVLAEVHKAVTGWPQRPGFASARDLLHRPRGGDVQLDAMPGDVVDMIRASWRPVLLSCDDTVIHGDPGPSNVLMVDDQVALIDWDEARVDTPSFDFADIPEDVTVPVNVDRSVLRTAGIAWETATSWTTEPEYAAHRLAELRTHCIAAEDSGGGQ